MRKMNPYSAKKQTVTAPLAAENAGVVNSETSIIGSALRYSSTMKDMISAAVIANPTRVGTDPQPRPGASMMVETSEPIAAEEATRPGTSTWASAGVPDAGTNRTVRIPPRTTSGASALNTGGQQQWA